MPMYLRRIIDSFSFVVALGVGAYIRYGIDGGWLAAIGIGIISFIVMPFIISRVWATYLIRRMERGISDGSIVRRAEEAAKNSERGKPLS